MTKQSLSALGQCYFNIIHCPQHQRQEINNLSFSFFSLYYIIEFHRKTSLCGKCLNFNAIGRFAVLLCYIAQSMLQKPLGQWAYNRIHCLQPYHTGVAFWQAILLSYLIVDFWMVTIDRDLPPIELAPVLICKVTFVIVRDWLWSLGQSEFNIIHCPQYQQHERNNPSKCSWKSSEKSNYEENFLILMS